MKAIFFIRNEDQSKSYIVSLKRHDKNKSKKDGQFPGGRVDKRKSAESTCSRNKEEDESLVLFEQLKLLKEHKKEYLRYKMIQLKDGTKHMVFSFH